MTRNLSQAKQRFVKVTLIFTRPPRMNTFSFQFGDFFFFQEITKPQSILILTLHGNTNFYTVLQAPYLRSQKKPW